MSQIINKHSILSEIKKTFSLTIPLVASQLIYACSGFIGTAMVARLGKDALAASVLVSTIWLTLSVFFFGILNAVSVLVSHQHGANNKNTICNIMGQAYLFGIMVCILILLSLCCVPFFLQLSAQPPQVLQLANEYVHALFWTIPGLVFLVISEQFLAGIGLSHLVLRISLMVVPIEIPLIYLLIFGKGGFPTCGLSGVGYGFALTYTVTSIGLFIYLLKSPRFASYALFTHLKKFNATYLIELTRLGLPLGFMSVIEVSTFALATVWMGRFGTTTLAAHQIVMQYLGFVITIVFAMSQAVTIRVGHAIGRQDPLGIHYAIYVGLFLNFCCILAIALAFYITPQTFLRLDLNIYDPANKALIREATALFSICAVLLLFDNFRIIGFGALRGLKDTKFSMLTSLLGFWIVGLTLAYLFGFSSKLQGSGIWWGLTLGIASSAGIIFIRVRYQLKRLSKYS